MQLKLLTLFLIVSFLAASSCKKQGDKEKPIQVICLSPQPLVGRWKWVGSGLPGHLYKTPAPGSQRLLILNSDSTYNMAGDDGVLTDPDIPPSMSGAPVLPDWKSGTGKFSLIYQSVGCTNMLSSTLYSDKYSLGAPFLMYSDTLRFTASPCLAPFYSYYVWQGMPTQ